jgi:hypothetical protein
VMLYIGLALLIVIGAAVVLVAVTSRHVPDSGPSQRHTDWLDGFYCGRGQLNYAERLERRRRIGL